MRTIFTFISFFLFALTFLPSKVFPWCGDSVRVELIRYDYDSLPTEKYVYNYDSLGREIVSTEYEWNGITWDLDNRVLTNYWNDTLIHEILTQLWDSNQWENYRMMRHTYNGNGMLLTYLDSIVYQQSGNLNIRLTENIRDINDVVIQSTNRHWNGSQWINDLRQWHNYDSLGRDTLFLREKGDSLNWVNDLRYSWSYDSFGNNTSAIYFEWNGTQWLNGSQTLTWFIGPLKDTLRIVQSGDSLSWNNSWLNRSVYDSLENRIYELTLLGQDTTWNNYREIYYYFTDTLNDSSLTRNWNSNLMAWVNLSRTFTLYDSLNRAMVTVTQNYDSNDSIFRNYRRHVNYYLENGRIDYQTDDIWNSYYWENECMYTPEYDSLGNLEYLENSCDYWGGCSDSWYNEDRDTNGVLLHSYYVYINCGDDEYITEKWFYYNQIVGDTAVCVTDSTVLSVLNCPGYTYLWNTGDTTASITVDTSGIYTVTITDGIQQIYTEPFQFYSTPELGATHAPDSVVHLCGTAYVLLSETPVPFATYQWLHNDSVLVNRTNSSLNVYSLTYPEGSYQVIVTTDCGSDTSSATIIFIHPYPSVQITAGGATSFCFGDSVLLSASAGFASYLWQPSNDSSQSVYASTSGYYTVTATDSNTCSVSTSQYVTVWAVPLQPVIYQDGPALYITNPSLINNWYHDTVLVQSSNSVTYASPQNGWYYVQTINSHGCVAYSDSFYYDSTALAAEAGLNKVICDNDSVTIGGNFSAFSGTAPYTYSWSPSSGLNNPSLGNPQASPDSTTTYYLTVTDSIGNSVTDSINVFVNQLPAPVISAPGHDICYGTSPNFAALTPHAQSYLWERDSFYVHSSIQPYLQVNVYLSGNYFVVVTDSNQCKGRSPDYYLNVHQYPLAPSLNYPPTVALCPNDSILLIASNPDPAATYEWKLNGLQVLTTDTFVYATQFANYTFVQTDSFGCETNSNIYVKVDSVLRPQLYSSADFICEGDSSLLYTADVPGYTYEWWKDFTIMSGADSASMWVTQSGEYVLYLTSPGGCSGHSFNKQITVNPLPIVTVYQSNDTLFFTPFINGSYQWFEVGDTIPLYMTWSSNFFIPPHAGDYYVVVYDDFSECSAASLPVHFLSCSVSYSAISPLCQGSCDGSIIPQPVNGFSPFTFLWSTGDTTATLDSLCAGNYSFTMTDDSGCTSTLPVLLSDPNAISIGVTSLPILCYGDCTGSAALIVTGGTPPYSYSWDTGDTSTVISNICSGNYFCTVQDSNNCIETALVTMTEPPPIASSFTGVDVLCNGECTGSFVTNISGGTSPYIYTDCLSQAFIPGTLCAGNYCALIYDANGCPATDSFIVAEPPVLSVISEVEDPSCSGCNDGYISLINSGGVPPYSVTWFPTNGFFSGDTIQSLPAGFYTVTVTDSNGCTFVLNDTLIDPPDWSENFQSDNFFRIYPNPVQEELIVVLPDNNSTSSIAIYDAPGNLLYKEESVGKNIKIDVRNFAEGYYWIEVNRNDNFFRKKFVRVGER